MTTDAASRFGQIGAIAVRTYNLDATVEFYGDTLGLRILFSSESMA